MRLADLLRDHYAPLKGISSRTTRLYEMTLASWSRTLGREPELGDLNEMEVAKFIGARKAARAAATYSASYFRASPALKVSISEGE